MKTKGNNCNWRYQSLVVHSTSVPLGVSFPVVLAESGTKEPYVLKML